MIISIRKKEPLKLGPVKNLVHVFLSFTLYNDTFFFYNTSKRNHKMKLILNIDKTVSLFESFFVWNDLKYINKTSRVSSLLHTANA